MSDVSLSPVPAVVVAARRAGRRPGTALRAVAALVALTKPRLGFFSVLTAMSAYAASGREAGVPHALATLIGTTLAAGGALSLNQWWERELDARMQRTRDRPLPQEQIAPEVALAWSLALSLAGVGLLAWQVNPAAAMIAAVTILIYGVIYTPLKRRTRWATEIGAISGALPPLLGAAAAGDTFSGPGWVLASILFFWQMPHFYAIGWMHRADYRAVGFPLLPAVDATGARTGWWSLGYTLALAAVSFVPWAMGAAGTTFGCTVLAAGGLMLLRAWQFATAAGDRDRAARRLFIASIAYLPLILGALLVDRLV